MPADFSNVSSGSSSTAAKTSPVQWTVDAFAGELNKLRLAALEEARALETQKLMLQNAYSIARRSNNASAMKFLDPLIHKNSDLRLKHRDLVGKFNRLASETAGLIKKAGLTPPSGLGVAPLVLVGAGAIATLLVCWGMIHSVQSGRIAIAKAFESNGASLLAIASDSSKPESERKWARDEYEKLMASFQKVAEQPPGSGLFGEITPILGLVAVILVAPSLLQTFNRSRS